eukprot:Phypoly_transcript_11173.p2 GENE.Phypoly_transcript_11173~~Phypoly_transcript_11173.p2  ORF type:complete len:137 (+),score=27.65 Phypoly_transcript_11173:795-1205(+)
MADIPPEKWTSHNVRMWVSGTHALTHFLPAFISFDLDGHDMLSLVSFKNPRGREGVQILAGNEPQQADALFAAIYALISGKEQLAVFLKKIGLAKYIDDFAKQEITWDLVHLLEEKDLTFLPVGPRVKFYAAIKKN